ncbi:MAG: hypothetical protein E6J90_40145 [Deltaproteobacteria bacterium]|nr:MAG: hypothetical protein E6J90_40145 [Deltaproteobacteria bacterium]TMQ15739.1 MAG: hypothetical protein E6J91_12875 [Deltaproteobacteria bacterium]
MTTPGGTLALLRGELGLELDDAPLGALALVATRRVLVALAPDRTWFWHVTGAGARRAWKSVQSNKMVVHHKR